MAGGTEPKNRAAATRPAWIGVKVLAKTMLALLLLTVLTVGSLWWWAGTDGSLSTALRWTASHQPLAYSEAKGSLRRGGQIKALVWRQDGITVEADNVTFEWQPWALLQRMLQINRLSASSLRVIDLRPPSPVPSLPPNALGLPLDIALRDFSITQLQWMGTPAVSLQAAQLTASYAYTGQQHQLQLKSVQFASGRYQGKATLGAAQPLVLDAVFSGTVNTPVPGTTSTLPLTFDASVKGPVTDLAANAQLRLLQSLNPGAATAQQATATAQIMPWADQPVRKADATFRNLNLGALWPQAPQTQLTGSASVKPEKASATLSTTPAPNIKTSDVWLWQTQMTNAVAGPWDKQRLPVDTLQAQGEWRGGVAAVHHLKARIGGGDVLADGRWANTAGQNWTAEATLQRVNPAALHSQLASLPLSGQVTVRSMATQSGESIGFETKLASAAAEVNTKVAEKAVNNAVNPMQLRAIAATGNWTGGQNKLVLSALHLRTDDADLSGSLDAQLPTRGGKANLLLTAPGLQAKVLGELSPTAGAGALSVTANDASQALRWLQRLPSMPGGLLAIAGAGRASLMLNWQGGWQDPAVQARLNAPLFDITTMNKASRATVNTTETPANTAPLANPNILKFRNVQATHNGKLSQAQTALQGQLEAEGRRYALQLSADGGRIGAANPKDFSSLAASSWQAVVKPFSATVEDPAQVSGAWRLTTLQNVALRWDASATGGAKASMTVGAGDLLLTAPTRAANPMPAARVQWQPVTWRGGELTTSGKITGLPMAWAELFASPQLAGAALSGDLVFDGAWDAQLSDTLRVKASLVRSSGDITLQGEAADSRSTKFAAGVRQASLTLETRPGDKDNQLSLALRWDSERAGTADALVSTRLVKSTEGVWAWAADAPLRGQLRAQLPRIGVWSVLAPPGWRLRGTLAADVVISGTWAVPLFAGNIEANDLALRSVVDGIELGNGRLRAQLDAAQGTRMKINEFYLQGIGSLDKKTPGGSLTAQGQAAWVDGQPQVLINAKLDKLRTSVRSDRQITLSGDLLARLDGALAQLTGKLQVDQALILLPDESTPQLGDDVVVRAVPGPSESRRAIGGQEPVAAASPPKPGDPKRNLKIAVQIDLGQDFRVQGKGLDTRLAGLLTLTGDSPVVAGQPIFTPRLVGTVNAVGGQYRAYGQRLDVEQGTLRFTGLLDNPILNILAIRPTTSRADQRVGVQIQGNVLQPRIRLYAEPDLPDAEKLSWLVLGRPSATGGAEAALLQQAALALLGSKNNASGGMSGGLAAAIGLDELSYRGSASNADGTTREGAITLGKRFSRNFYAAYERSVSGAVGTLFVFFDVSQRVTLRGQAGEQSAVDLIYTFSFDGKR